jgi:hypothetical protein
MLELHSTTTLESDVAADVIRRWRAYVESVMLHCGKVTHHTPQGTQSG